MLKNLNPKEVWDREYSERRLMKGEKPPKSLLKFIKFLKKEEGLRGKELPFENFKILDLGSGEAKNAAHFAGLGAEIWALELSSVAHRNAIAKYSNLESIHFLNESFAKKLDFEDAFFDIALDVTSSNSLTSAERDLHLGEVSRVLKPGGFFFVRALLKDGDENAKKLLKLYPGSEEGSYILPGLNLQEKVFSKDEFKKLYSKYFDILKLEEETHHINFEGRIYKRRFLIAYLHKKA